jgi:hypothetical protein
MYGLEGHLGRSHCRVPLPRDLVALARHTQHSRVVGEQSSRQHVLRPREKTGAHRVNGAHHVLILEEQVLGVAGRGSESLHPVHALGEAPVDDFGETLFFEVQFTRERGSGRALRRRLRPDELQVAEGYGMKEEANPPSAGFEAPGKVVEDLGPAVVGQCVLVEGHESDAPLPDLLELGLDAAHRSAAIAVDDADVEAVFG